MQVALEASLFRMPLDRVLAQIDQSYHLEVSRSLKPRGGGGTLSLNPDKEAPLALALKGALSLALGLAL